MPVEMAVVDFIATEGKELRGKVLNGGNPEYYETKENSGTSNSQ
jgi:hypothetical protein